MLLPGMRGLSVARFFRELFRHLREHSTTGTAASAPTVIVCSLYAPGASGAVFTLTWNVPVPVCVGVPEATTVFVAGSTRMNDVVTASYADPAKVVVRLY